MFFVGFCISLLRALRVIRKIMKESDFWCTPLDLYPVDCFDPCPKNPSFDGLSVDWFGNVFCNPPYSQIDLWVDKALQQVSNADSIVCALFFSFVFFRVLVVFVVVCFLVRLS